MQLLKGAVGEDRKGEYTTAIARYVAYLALYKKIPKNNHLSTYLIQSVIRISDDKKYIIQMTELLEDSSKKKKERASVVWLRPRSRSIL